MISAAKLDEVPKWAWIAGIVLGFMAWWPVGLGLLIFLAATGRLPVPMMCGGGRGRWHNTERNGRRGGCGWGGRDGWRGRSSGNQAFDDYREETLRRLEEEQREFSEYLDRLRRARDKEEFDRFMADRRRRPEPPETTPPATE